MKIKYYDDIENVVYGVEYNKHNVDFFVFDGELNSIEKLPELGCKVIDNRISKYWVVGNHITNEGNLNLIMSFPEWVYHDDFYWHLFDSHIPEREEWAKEIFFKYKELMDQEFK